MTLSNNPPPFEAISLEVEDLFDIANSIGTAESEEQAAQLDALLSQFRDAKKRADAERVAEKRPHDEAAKSVQAKWKPVLDRCEIGLDAVKKAVTPFRVAQQRARDEAERIAREKAQAEFEAAQAMHKSDDLDERLAAEERAATAKALQAQANKLGKAKTGLRSNWVAEITDRKAALMHYLRERPDEFEALLQRMADSDARNEATRRDIPGVKFTERKEAW
jgi:hypothetical protein